MDDLEAGMVCPVGSITGPAVTLHNSFSHAREMQAESSRGLKLTWKNITASNDPSPSVPASVAIKLGPLRMRCVVL